MKTSPPKFKVLLILFSVSIFSTACISPAPKSPAAKPTVETKPTSAKSSAAIKVNPTKSIDAIEFLTFAETFSNLPLDSQKQALLETNQALAINPNDLLHRMRLVMIYGLPSSNLLDTPKAQNLLQQILQEDILANSQLAFANLLFDHLVVANKVSKPNGGDQKRVDSLQQKNEALQLKLDQTLQKLEASQQKLDDLKKIEKSMGERDFKPKQ